MKGPYKTGLRTFFFLLFLSSVSLVEARDSTILAEATDTQWLKFMADNAFKLEGLQSKLPLMADELHLNASDLQEVDNLFSDHGDEKLLSQMATSPGIRGSSQDESLNKAQSETKKDNYLEMEDNAADAPAETLREVRIVRNRLGHRDMNFRFWFFEEGMIDQAEKKAYDHDHNYSVDELGDSVIEAIKETQEFKDFEERETLLIRDDQKVENYFSNWRRSIEKRITLQIQQVKHRVNPASSAENRLHAVKNTKNVRKENS
jgi:hypothetical protein